MYRKSFRIFFTFRSSLKHKDPVTIIYTINHGSDTIHSVESSY